MLSMLSEGTVRKNTTYKTSAVSESRSSAGALKSTPATVRSSASAKKPLHAIAESGSPPSSDQKAGYCSEERQDEQSQFTETRSDSATSVLSSKSNTDIERVIIEKNAEDPSKPTLETEGITSDKKSSEFSSSKMLTDVVSRTESAEVASLQTPAELPESDETQNAIVTESSSSTMSQATCDEDSASAINTDTSVANDTKSWIRQETGQIGSGKLDNCVVAHGGNECASAVSGRRATRSAVKGTSDASSLNISFQEEMKQALIRRKAILAQQMGAEESDRSSTDAGAPGDNAGGAGAGGTEDEDPSQQPHYENWLFEVTQGVERYDVWFLVT